MINHPRELQGKVIYLSFTARRHGWPSQAGPRVGRVSLLEGVVVEEVDSVLDVKFTSSCFWPRCHMCACMGWFPVCMSNQFGVLGQPSLCNEISIALATAANKRCVPSTIFE